jgi:hypothetical protein
MINYNPTSQTRQYEREQREKLEELEVFRKDIDKLFFERHPKSNFVLMSEDEKVLRAYNKLINPVK